MVAHKVAGHRSRVLAATGMAAQKPAVYAEILVGRFDRVVAGEHDFTYWTWEGVALTKLEQGAPIRWVRPAPTPTLASSFQAISKYAPHPHAARLFQNWSMSEEGGLVIQNLYGSESSIGGLKDQRPITRQPWHKPVAEEYLVDFKRWDRDLPQRHGCLDRHPQTAQVSASPAGRPPPARPG